MIDHFIKSNNTVHPEIIKAMTANPFNLNHFLRTCEKYQEDRTIQKRIKPKESIEARRKMAKKKIKTGAKAQRQLMEKDDHIIQKTIPLE